jgi:hypothetical protein
LKGIYGYSLYQGSQAPLSSVRYSFEVSIKGCLWSIQYENSAALTNSDILVAQSIAACDGKDIYVIEFQSESAVKKALGDRYDSVKPGLPAAMVHIYSGAYPPPKEPFLQHIWLALAAANCVLRDPEGQAKPPFLADMAVFYNPDNVCGYRWVRDDSGSGLRKLLFLSDGGFLRRDESGEVRHTKYAPPYDKGYTLGVGLWLQATNIGGLSLPLDFQYTGFSPKPGGSNSTELLRTIEYRCMVTNVCSTEMPQVPPVLPRAKALVSDWRFADRGYGCVDYVVTNRWVATNDADVPALLQRFPKVSLERQAREELGIPPQPPKRWLFRATLFSLAVFPLAYWLARRIIRRNKQQVKES